MEFTFVDELGIQTDLAVLRRDTQPYTALLYQHEGILDANAHKIGNFQDGGNRVRAFISKALETEVDLALTPEYCCPWKLVEEVINDDSRQPRPGRLWVIGCESITKTDLAVFQKKHTADDVLVYFEQQVMDSNRSFLDPLVYIFKGKYQGLNKLIVLVQFKTYHMGVWGGGDVEADNIILGHSVYVLRNSISSVNFLSLICSEAMNFPNAMNAAAMRKLEWNDKPFLIFNPQLNPEPTYSRFCDFRKFVMSTERKEVISLNWTSTSYIDGKPITRHNSSRSGFWIHSTEVNLANSRVKDNHRLGLYYFSMGPHKHTFIFNSTVHAIYLRNWSVHITEGMPVQRRRQGPEVIHAYFRNDVKNVLEASIEPISDGHMSYFKEVGCTSVFLNTDHACLLEKEILVCLTSGKIPKRPSANWYEISQLYSWKSDESTECNHRITFVEDHMDQNIIQRTSYLNAIREIEVNVFGKPDIFPPIMHSLRSEKLIVGFTNSSKYENYYFNVCNEQGEGKVVTVAFLDSPIEKEVSQVYQSLRSLFTGTDKSRDRVVVFYRRGNNIMCKYDQNSGKISETNTYSDQSILK